MCIYIALGSMYEVRTLNAILVLPQYYYYATRWPELDSNQGNPGGEAGLLPLDHLDIKH